ncbi:MAG: hypothetical protein B6U77_01485 [Candidatus Hecatellales archaeon ex4484_218]|nr:MAG: hypothetical protein B6U77_01485 [Candidatus Hecatellales archaeon ex4484_218]
MKGIMEMMVKVLGVIPLSATKSFGTYRVQYLDLLLVADAGILVLKNVCKLKGLEDVFPISQKRLSELFKNLPRNAGEFRKYIYSIIGLSINLDRLAKILGRKFSERCILIPYRNMVRLRLEKRRVFMIVIKVNIMEVKIDTEKKNYCFLVLPGGYKDVTEDVAYAEVLDMLRKAKFPITT